MTWKGLTVLMSIVMICGAAMGVVMAWILHK